MSSRSGTLDKQIAANGRTASENFERWFGASAVVDPQGAPKVVYHSTCNDFDKFSKTRDLGFHFGSVAVAEGRIKEGVKGRGKGDEKYSGLNIIAAHLSIRNPLHFKEDPNAWEPAYLLQLIGDRLPASTVRSLTEMDLNCTAAARTQAQALKDAARPGLVRKKQPWTGGKVFVELQNSTWRRVLESNRCDLFAQMRKDLQAAGFDGLTYVNEVEGDGRGPKGRGANPENLTWVAFEASQIKSAIGNSGLYLKDSASMTDGQADRDLRLVTKARALFLIKPIKSRRSLEVSL